MPRQTKQQDFVFVVVFVGGVPRLGLVAKMVESRLLNQTDLDSDPHMGHESCVSVI